MRISDWSSDVCSSDLVHQGAIEDSGTTIAEHRVDPLGQIALRRRADDQRTTETKPRKLIAERSQATRREYRSSWIGLVSETQLHLNLSRSEDHTSELPSLMRISYAVFCLTKKITNNTNTY